MFGPGLLSFGYRPTGRLGKLKRRVRSAAQTLAGRYPHAPNSEAGIEHGYFYAQQFLPDNAFDTRVTIIGNRAFGYRRMNRPGDFRASGSGLQNADFTTEKVDIEAVRLAFRAVLSLGADTLSTDILRCEDRPVLGEVGSAYPAWTVSRCRGHWVLRGDRDDGQLDWVDGEMRVEDALFSTFLDKLGIRDAGIVPAPGSP